MDRLAQLAVSDYTILAHNRRSFGAAVPENDFGDVH
jgi:hypothetical protein